jgi:hypothetical protein
MPLGIGVRYQGFRERTLNAVLLQPPVDGRCRRYVATAGFLALVRCWIKEPDSLSHISQTDPIRFSNRAVRQVVSA